MSFFFTFDFKIKLYTIWPILKASGVIEWADDWVTDTKYYVNPCCYSKNEIYVNNVL
jgi:hypothetical protein